MLVVVGVGFVGGVSSSRGSGRFGTADMVGERWRCVTEMVMLDGNVALTILDERRLERDF